MTMFEPKVVFNRENCNEKSARMYPTDVNEIAEVLISVNPVYDWLEENVNNISYKLLKGFITNIVPLGYASKKYFKTIANKKTGFTKELWKLYNQLEKMHCEGNLKINSYLELSYLGYTGGWLGGKCPVDDIIKYLEE